MGRRISLIGLVLAICSAACAQWQLQDSHTTADLRGIHSIGKGVAWASGTNGTVLRTLDGGSLWQPCAVPPEAEHLDFRGIQAFDASTAILMSSGKGDLSRLYKTTDGCKTWTLMLKNTDPEGFFDAFWLNGPGGEGMLIGDPVNDRFMVLQTENGGANWTLDRSPSLRLHGHSIAAFAASNSSLAKAKRGAGDTRGSGTDFFPGFVTGGNDGAFIFERWEGRSRTKARYGRKMPGLPPPDWNRRSIPLSTGNKSSGAFALSLRYTGNPCQDCGFGAYWFPVVVGGDYLKPKDGARTAAYSTDGGWTWTLAATCPNGYRSAVAYDDALKTWITVGPNGTDISTDDGKNWRAVHPDQALNEAPDADRNWNALSLPFVVGPKGRIGRLDRTRF